GGHKWHNLKLEYPASDKSAMDGFVTRASHALAAYITEPVASRCSVLRSPDSIRLFSSATAHRLMLARRRITRGLMLHFSVQFGPDNNDGYRSQQLLGSDRIRLIADYV